MRIQLSREAGNLLVVLCLSELNKYDTSTNKIDCLRWKKI